MQITEYLREEGNYGRAYWEIQLIGNHFRILGITDSLEFLFVVVRHAMERHIFLIKLPAPAYPSIVKNMKEI